MPTRVNCRLPTHVDGECDLPRWHCQDVTCPDVTETPRFLGRLIGGALPSVRTSALLALKRAVAVEYLAAYSTCPAPL